jgi:gamma-glutamylcyclotransferase
MIHYFAYGSNLHPLRLAKRVPSARLVGIADLKKHCLSFHKKSIDGSSKCNILKTHHESDIVHGAIYQLDLNHKAALDRFENKGNGYMDSPVTLHHKGQQYTCFTYRAQESHIDDDLMPYHWYKNLVVLGAKYLQLPEPYVSSLESIRSIDDPDPTRKVESEKLIQEIINFF